jgi:hypothetical protein
LVFARAMFTLRSAVLAAAFMVVTLGIGTAGAANWDAGATVETDEPVQGIVAGTVNAELAIVGGSGILGGTVGVEILLSNDVANAGISADLDIAYLADVVEFRRPVDGNCRVDPRLAATHQVGGTVPRPGILRFALFSPTTLTPVGDGRLATCDFHILPGAAAGTAALTIEYIALTGIHGDIPVVGVPGLITITAFTPGPTPTETPIPAPCVGDCDGNQAVSVAELIRGVGISLGLQDLSACPSFDANGDGAVSINELITAVNRTLMGCAA